MRIPELMYLSTPAIERDLNRLPASFIDLSFRLSRQSVTGERALGHHHGAVLATLVAARILSDAHGSREHLGPVQAIIVGGRGLGVEGEWGSRFHGHVVVVEWPLCAPVRVMRVYVARCHFTLHGGLCSTPRGHGACKIGFKLAFVLYSTTRGMSFHQKIKNKPYLSGLKPLDEEG